jgi:hypothetical protein
MVGWVLADATVERFGGDRLDAMLAARDAVAEAEAAALHPAQVATAGRGGADAPIEEEIDG